MSRNFDDPGFGTRKQGCVTIPGRSFDPNDCEYLSRAISTSRCVRINVSESLSRVSFNCRLSWPSYLQIRCSTEAEGQNPWQKPHNIEVTNSRFGWDTDNSSNTPVRMGVTTLKRSVFPSIISVTNE